ncbi:MAG TPA: type II toxin-antitoxin system HicB family antitoxin [Methylocystis sp.]|nr:type II toxin-antitoxin system HicB family antitoxin [Methylocystis sp.]
MTIKPTEYPLIVEPLSEEDGGGFVARAPDLPGCMSDGETPEEAVVNARGAILAWIEAAEDMGHQVPPPSRRLGLAS